MHIFVILHCCHKTGASIAVSDFNKVWEQLSAFEFEVIQSSEVGINRSNRTKSVTGIDEDLNFESTYCLHTRSS